MTEGAETVARQAFAALASGDLASVLSLVDAELEWTFLDPSAPDPEPAVCPGRDQLAYWMGRNSRWSAQADLVEVVANGDRVLIVTSLPGIDTRRVRRTGDLSFHIVTVRDGMITALRACRSRDEALGLLTPPAAR